LRRLGLCAIGLAALVAVANVPTTTYQGVNFVVSARTLPAYVKALDFADRDANYKGLARQIAGRASSDEARLRAVFDWTRANIRDTPTGFPVVDDHVWHIIIRGYGEDDQKADVFTTLLTYAGVRAYWIFIGPRPELVLSFVKADGAWRVLDVANGVMFRSRDGHGATADDVAADPAFAAAQGPAVYRGVPYAARFDGFRAPIPPDLTRADMQVPGARTWFAIKRWLGSGGRQWEMRPASRHK
jgi:hypothetical protein